MGKCYQKIEINAEIETVWQKIANFHDMSWADGVITSLVKVGPASGTEIGAKRLLNDAIHETLVSVDGGNFTFSYSIDDGPGPIAKSAVTNYLGVVKLSECCAGTLVEWSSSFTSVNESAVTEFCDPIYLALLGALKGSLAFDG
ncbi:SRPBCC family protein [Colwellia psychrerythraea]|uniref:Polyketide cyclase/dehydrase n=1 Tax=Colwellia psychrerythraea TaxID=28229 RepID=A0A099KQV6_COLPS|nr:SRPBCC family protein [Colwellia psychrerythraea]KGJ92287.1 Polyketide cyclase/dehydrase [Colwellia psychrerythraea]